MNEVLPIGSIVQLNNGEVKLMIINRYPLYNNYGVIGYFDYSGCVYPNGSLDNQAYFFNEENIAKVWFKGYIDESEELLQQKFKKETDNINYPRLSLDE